MLSTIFARGLRTFQRVRLIGALLACGPAAVWAAAPSPIAAPALPAPAVQPIALRIGFCVSSALRTATIEVTGGAGELLPPDAPPQGANRWDLGGAAVGTLERTLRASFETVEFVGACGIDPPSAAAQLMLSADLDDAEVLVPRRALLASAQAVARQAHVDFRLTLQSNRGGPSFIWKVVGRAAAAPSRSKDAEVAATLEGALRNASARLLVDLATNAEVRSWLTANGASDAALSMPDLPAADGATLEVASRPGKIAVLSNGLDPQFAERSTRCVHDALRSRGGGLPLISEGDVRDDFFPWFEPGILSMQSADAVAAVLAGRLIRARAVASDVQFVVMLTHVGSNSRMNGPFWCGGSGEGAGCLGAALLTRQSQIDATLWDVRRGLQMSSLAGQGRARDALVGFVLPIWIPMGRSTKTLACRDMANSLLEVVHGDPAARLAPIAAVSLSEPAAAAPSSDFAAAPSAEPAPAPERGVTYTGIRWYPGTADIANVRTYDYGTRGTLRVTDRSLIFRPDHGSSVEAREDEVRIPYGDIASVEYRTRRFSGSFLFRVQSIVIIRTDGEVVSFTIVRRIFPDARETQALAGVLQSRLHGYGLVVTQD